MAWASAGRPPTRRRSPRRWRRSAAAWASTTAGWTLLQSGRWLSPTLRQSCAEGSPSAPSGRRPPRARTRALGRRCGSTTRTSSTPPTSRPRRARPWGSSWPRRCSPSTAATPTDRRSTTQTWRWFAACSASRRSLCRGPAATSWSSTTAASVTAAIPSQGRVGCSSPCARPRPCSNSNQCCLLVPSRHHSPQYLCLACNRTS
mmetsp:Transcript_1278/g.4580  ORF Transcript_1278/g.4580 Transcript_1278/m.4580 type:complete len:203 (-) Transcript_1278:23-631(-)